MALSDSCRGYFAFVEVRPRGNDDLSFKQPEGGCSVLMQ